MSEQSDISMEIVRGEKAVIDFYLERTNKFPRSVDLTNFDEFSICLPSTTGPDDYVIVTQDPGDNDSVLEKISPGELGHLRLTLNSEDSDLVNEGFGQDYQIHRNNSTTPNLKITRSEGGLVVHRKRC